MRVIIWQLKILSFPFLNLGFCICHWISVYYIILIYIHWYYLSLYVFLQYGYWYSGEYIIWDVKIDVITCLAIWLCLTAIGNKATTCTTSCNLRLRDSWQGHYMALTSKNNCILRRNIIDMYVIIQYTQFNLYIYVTYITNFDLLST